jgi:hypothetical protein
MGSRKHVPSFDLEGALATVPVPSSVEPVAAGFFHRTLARWLGLPEGRMPSKAPDVTWSYSFWKAELAQVEADGARQTWEARVFQTASERDEDAATFRYWIELDKQARIKRSGWLSAPPDLLSERDTWQRPAAVVAAEAERAARLFETLEDTGEHPAPGDDDGAKGAQ